MLVGKCTPKGFRAECSGMHSLGEGVNAGWKVRPTPQRVFRAEHSEDAITWCVGG